MAASRVNHLSGAVMAALMAGSTLLAGCGEHHVAPAQEASDSAPRPDDLAGAPADASAPPPSAEMAPPPETTPPPPMAERLGDREVIYDLGPVVRAHDTMAPIPNPPETRTTARRHGEGRSARRIHRRMRMAHAPRHRMSTARPMAAPHHPAHAMAPRSARSAPAAAKPLTSHRAAHPAPNPAASPGGAVPLASGKPAAHGATKAAPDTKPAPVTSGERAQQLSALQTSLRDAVSRSAVLSAPALKPGQPSEVTLTLPADFASVVRDEAGKQRLSDAATSVNLTALLSGDGYAVAPDETQSQPLTIGQPTEFHWQVTAQADAKGPLHADVGADLLGGGDSALQLGSVSPSGGGLHVSPRAWGAALLVLLAIIVFAWLSRGRRGAARRPARPVSAYDRPLDMNTSVPPSERDR